MVSGREALRSIRKRIDEAKEQYDHLNRSIRELEAEHTSALDEERHVLTSLAEAYLPELTQEALSNGLAQMKTRVAQVLHRQSERKSDLQTSVQAYRDRQAEAEGELARKKAGVVVAEERVEANRAAVAGVLEGDAEYRSSAEEHSALMDRRDRLKSRRAKLLAVAVVERPSYDGFAPFRYLVDRAYGEPEYRIGWISRIFDRWLAKRIDFPTLYRNHRLLKLGPHQIQAEIVRSSRRAGELEAQMDATEEKAAEAVGLTGTLVELAEAHAQADRARAIRDEARSVDEAKESELRELETNRGRYYDRAIELHREHLGEKPIRELELMARQTPGAEDDALVHRLDEARSRIDSTESRGRELLAELRAAGERVDGLLQMEEAGQRDFGSFRSHFREGLGLDALLGEYVEGVESWGGVIDRMNEVHVQRPVGGSMLGDILSEVAASLSDSPLEYEYSIDTADDSVISTVVRDHGMVVTRRVTRRMSGRESSWRPSTTQTLDVVWEETD